MTDKKRAWFETYKGTKILVMDYTDMTDKEKILAALNKTSDFCTSLPPKSALTVTDVSNSSFDMEVAEAMKAAAKKNAPHIRASTAVGVKGLKKVILPVIAQFSGRDYKVFESREEAFDWLASLDTRS